MVSLPLEKKGEGQKIAVKIVDDRGIESLKVMEVGVNGTMDGTGILIR